MDRRFWNIINCFSGYTCISDPSGIMTQLPRLSNKTAEQVVEAQIWAKPSTNNWQDHVNCSQNTRVSAEVWTWMVNTVHYPFNPQWPESNFSLQYNYLINIIVQVTRTKEMITKDNMFWCLNRFSQQVL